MPSTRQKDAAEVADNLVELWELGNLAFRWAGAPLALSPDELDQYRDLCQKARVDPVTLLYRFQQFHQEAAMAARQEQARSESWPDPKDQTVKREEDLTAP